MPREQKSTDKVMYNKLQHAFELLAEAQTVLTEAFALQGAAAPSTYKAIDKAWASVDKAAKYIDDVRYK